MNDQYKKLETVDGGTLMSMPLTPTKFIVGELIPQGLHILGGSPKVGKSWLVLWLCLKISKGENVWSFETTESDVLYLCLEDSLNRIHNRLESITDEADEKIHFSVFANNIENGLWFQIEKFIEEHPETSFIVIDTLQKVRGTNNISNPYASDYNDLTVLKQIADKHQIAILLVHHLRKMNDDDPMNMISGTTGITGVADGIYVLKKDKRSENKAKLFCTGRDIEYMELELTLDEDSHVWQMESTEVLKPKDKILDTVREFILAKKYFSGSATELCEAIEIETGVKLPPNSVGKKLLNGQDELLINGITVESDRSNIKKTFILCLS